ncbi:MAG TPA: hypothetical protein ENJ42_02555 [Hellea balneolensis]|uniref:Rap1a immunity protein domain-containing protein n=1 Tax=Hellea balneolensis TaxID=287478 RepID=A0A7C5LSL7_9PROT|nr:hypothetical protein [Hellea balneolensis]
MKYATMMTCMIGLMFGGQISLAQTYSKKFTEREKTLGNQCIEVYSNNPENGDLIVSTCKQNLADMRALREMTSGLTDIDIRMFNLYTSMTNAILTIGVLRQNGNRPTSTVCSYARDAVGLGKQVGFRKDSDFEAIVQNMVNGYEKYILPSCPAP